MSSLGDRAWWAYHCLPRDEYGSPPPTTALEQRADLSRGLIGKLHNGKQQSVESDIGERLAGVLGTTYDFLIRGLGDWPAPTGPMGPRIIKYNRGQRLDKPVFHTVKPDVQNTAAGAMDPEESKGEITPEMQELAAAQLKVRRPDLPMTEIVPAVKALAALRHQQPLEAESLSNLAELVIRVGRGEIEDTVISGLIIARSEAKKKSSRKVG
jgi:hypothetical protein